MRTIPKKTITIEFKSDIECLDEKELVAEIVEIGGLSRRVTALSQVVDCY